MDKQKHSFTSNSNIMKHFLKQIIFYGFIIVVLLISFDTFISYNLRHSSDRRFIVWTEIIEKEINADLLVMGSSRAWVQISPKIIDTILDVNSYNLGIDGSHIDRQIMRYDLYKLYNPRPQVILHNIDFMSVLSKKVGYEREQFFPYFTNRDMMAVIHEEPFAWQERYLPYYRYYGYRDLLGNYNHSKDSLYKGYRGQERDWNGSLFSSIDSLHFNCDESLKAMLIDYVQEVKNDSINLIFVYAPFYIEAVKKVDNLDEMYSIFDSIAKAYDVPILDYTYSYLSYDTTYFYNASHLNKRGAELFTTMLANDLDSLGIK